MYIVSRAATLSTPAFDPFVVDPSYCPLSYAFLTVPVIPPANDPITLDQSTRIFTYYSIDISLVSIYTVTVSALTPLGFDTGISFDYDVDF